MKYRPQAIIAVPDLGPLGQLLGPYSKVPVIATGGVADARTAAAAFALGASAVQAGS